jgi:H+/gluconate symporter-like permease
MLTSLYELTVLLGGLALLTVLVVQGRSIFVVAPLCALVTVTLSSLNPLAAMTGPYMTGFADFVKSFYLIALGAVFGRSWDQTSPPRTASTATRCSSAWSIRAASFARSI